MSRNEKLKWGITVLFPLLFFLIPVSETFTGQMRLFFVVTCMVIMVMAFELAPIIVPSLAFPLLYIITGLAGPKVAFSAWLSPSPWMTLAGLVMANILNSTGLLKRGAYWGVIKSGATYNGILYALLIVGIVFNLFVPGQALIPMALLTFSVCQALNLEKSKESSGIMLAGFFGATLPMYFFYSSHFVMFQSVGMSVTDVTISWMTFLFHNLPLIPWAFLVIFMVSKLLKPGKVVSGKEEFQRELDAMGPMTAREKKAVVICIAMIVMLVTNTIHNIQPAWVLMLFVCICFIPGIGIGTKESVENVNYPFIFLVTGCMAIGEVSGSLGIGAWISNMLIPILSQSGTTFTLICAWLLAFVMNFLLSPLAIASTFTAPLTQMALDLSINPLTFYYSMMQGADQILLPYEWPYFMVFFSFGLISMKDFFKVYSTKLVVGFLYFVVVLIPFWHLIHLL